MSYHPPRHRKIFTLVVPFAATLSILLTLTAIGGSTASGSAASTKTQQKQMGTPPVVKGSGGTVVIRAQEDIDTFNPAVDNGTYLDFSTYAFTYDTLATLSPQGILRPGLATKWTGTPYKVTFWIHKGATCDDGTPVTPAVIANSMNYYANPKTGAGIESVIFGLGSAHTTANAAADTVTITVSKPWGYLLEGAATAAYVICPAGLKDPSLMNEKPMGSGPYEMTSDQRGVEYTLQARPKYNWGPGGWSTRNNGVPQTLIERVIVNPVTAMNEGLTGAVQIDGYINGKAVEEMKSRDPSLMYRRQADLGAMAMVFNPLESKSAPVSDPVVRRAIDFAINGNDFMLAAASSQGVVSKTMLTPGMTCYSPALGKYAASYRPTKAEQILKADGWKLNSSGESHMDDARRPQVKPTPLSQKKRLNTPHHDPITAASSASLRVASSTLWNRRSWPSVAITPKRSNAAWARTDSSRAIAKSTPRARHCAMTSFRMRAAVKSISTMLLASSTTAASRRRRGRWRRACRAGTDRR